MNRAIEYYLIKVINFIIMLWSNFKIISFNNKLYILVMFLGFVLLAINIFHVTPEDENLDNSTQIISTLIEYLIIALTVVAVLIEFIKILVVVHEKIWFKWIAGFITIFLYAVSGMYMDSFINGYVGIDPSLLPIASTVLTLVFLIPCWILATSILIPVFIIGASFNKTTDSKSANSGFVMSKELTFYFRAVGWFYIIYAAAFFVDKFNDKNSFLVTLSQNIVLSSEYFKKTHCTNVREKEKSADIGRGYISIYDIAVKTFRTEKCIYKI